MIVPNGSIQLTFAEWDAMAAEVEALRARVAELEAMNKMLCGKLDDQRRALWDPCAPYLKDGETPAQCIARNRRDVDIALSSLARDRARIAELEVIAISICAGNCLPPFPCAQDGCPKRTASNKSEVPNGCLIEVAQQMPEEYVPVLGYVPHRAHDRRWAICHWYTHSSGQVMWWVDSSCGAGERPLTHWMPLPEPPKRCADSAPEGRK